MSLRKDAEQSSALLGLAELPLPLMISSLFRIVFLRIEFIWIPFGFWEGTWSRRIAP